MITSPIVVGHRGWPARYPDNTLSGFIAVSDLVPMVELDVRRSGDGKLVLSHDAAILGHLVTETPWSVLCRLDLGDFHHPALLDEVLAALPTTRVQLEVKNDPGDPGYEPDSRLALETAARARPGDILTSFDRKTLADVRRSFPDVATGLAVYFGSEIDESVEHCLDVGHSALVPLHLMVEDHDFDGLEVYPYTVNQPERALELAALGVTGIITDDATAILAVFEEQT